MRNVSVTFGEIMLRLAPPRSECFLPSPQFMASFGSSEANVAVVGRELHGSKYVKQPKVR